MNTNETITRLRELQAIENQLKKNRDFNGLIDVHNEVMSLSNSADSFARRIPQKAYCLARLGRIKEAEAAMRQISGFRIDDELYRAITLLSFFTTQNGAANLNDMQIETIKAWLTDSEASAQVKQIIFDYPDLISKHSIMNPFASREEAQNYCYGAAMAVNTQRGTVASFQRTLDALIEKAKNDNALKKLSFQELVQLTIKLTRDKLVSDGEKLNDLDAVGWQMGIFCYVWRNSLPVCNNKFDEIFIESWIAYFAPAKTT